MVDELKKIQTELRYNNMLAVPSIHRAGSLAMLWKEEITLHIQTYFQNHIDAHILTDLANPVRLIGFYGRLEEHRRHESLIMKNLNISCNMSSFQQPQHISAQR